MSCAQNGAGRADTHLDGAVLNAIEGGHPTSGRKGSWQRERVS